MATDQPAKPNPITPQDTAIPVELFEHAKALLDEIYAYSDTHPLASAKLSIKIGIALRDIEYSSVHKARASKRLSWARISAALNLPPRYAEEHYTRPNPKRVRRMKKEVIDELAEAAFRVVKNEDL